MSPEAPKPEVPTQAGSDQFVEGHHPTDRVRPFKHGDLHDVHDHLLDRGVPSVTDIDPSTLDVRVDKIAISSETQSPRLETVPMANIEKSSRDWKKWMAGVVGGTVLIGGSYVAYDNLNPDEKRSGSTLAPDFREKAPVSSSGIDNLISKSETEDIRFVIENPINTADYPYAEDQLTELGKRWNVVMNAADPDFSGPVGSIDFTAESESNFVAMTNTFLDLSSPSYASIVESMQKRSHQIGSMFYLDPGAETQLSFNPTEAATTLLEPGGTATINANLVWTTNQPDTKTSDGEYNSDYNANVTLVADTDGTVRIYEIDVLQNLGNIG